MGSSSKKSKKESKHKKHKRSSPSYNRDDSGSPDAKRLRPDSRDEDKSSKHKKHHKKKNKRERDHESESPRMEERRDSRREDKTEVNGRSKKNVTPVEDSNAREGSTSLSIGETNQLRAKLGLKPLDVGDASKEKNTDEKEDFVHAPAEDLWEKKKQEEMREKLRAIKERRNLNKRMGKVKNMADEEEDEMDAVSWVQRSRTSEQKKKREEERKKEMARMDDEFGVGGLVKKELADMRNESYTSKDLKGLAVKHSLEIFKEGRSEILTLEDKNILDDDNEDVLVGTNLEDLEKAKRNIEIKSKGSTYQAYEEEEVDEMGFFKPKSTLSKYDEEIDGIKKDEFRIGVHGKIDTTWVQQKAAMKKEIKAQGVSLAPPQLKIVSEYLTEEEMKFKKRKKKVRKVRKRDTFKADDLQPLPGFASASDLGSRGKMKPGSIPGWDEGIEGAKVDDTSITSTTMMINPSKSVILDEDDDRNELQKALDKARKAKFVKAKMGSEDSGAAKVAKHLDVWSRIKVENPVANYSTTISLNSTDEFCRQVGIGSDLDVVKEEPMHEESMIEDVDMDVDDGDQEETPGWNYVKESTGEAGTSTTQHQEPQEDNHAPIEAEPLAGGGLAGALKLAGRKGYLMEESKKSSVTLTNKQRELLSANYSIEDKNAVDHLDKYAHEKYSKDRNRYDRGIVTEFEEKKNYKPQIIIEYVDEAGRSIDHKEAFRKLSHRFHGKGSGKMKQEKRQKKKIEQDMMMRMSSTDTPLNTVAMMKVKLQTEASPYIVLSGAGKTFQAGGAGPMAKK